jgi:Tfp pilus assembly protein PilF
MNKEQTEYLLKNYRTRSVKTMADTLGLDRKEVQRELKRLLARKAEAGREGTAPSARKTLAPLVAAVALAALSFAFYARAVSFPFINWDDPKYVTENRHIRSLAPANLGVMFSKPYFGLYIPLTLVSYAVDYKFSHFSPAGYHATNVALHAANTALAYAVVHTVTRDPAVALATALLFAIHPVQVESVVWIAERKNVLSGFFFLASFLAWVRSRRRSGAEKRWRGAGWSSAPGGANAQPGDGYPAPSGWLGASAVFFTLACLAKPSAVVLPLVFAIYDLAEGKKPWKEPLLYLPFFAAGLVITGITVAITRGEGDLVYHGGSLAVTMRAMAVVMMKYFELLLFPLRQSLLYEFPAYASVVHPHVALSSLGVAFAAVGLVYLWRRDRRAAFWGAWYVALLLPVMNLIPFPSLMNDRYLYLPLVGFFSLIFLLLKARFGTGGVAVLALAAGFAFSFLNWKRQDMWSHPEALWRETQAKVAQESTAPYVNLGTHYLRTGDLESAIGEFEKALAISEAPEAMSGLGTAHLQKGDPEKAASFFQRAIAIKPEDAAYHGNLGLAYKEAKQFGRAEEAYRLAIRLDPGDPAPRNNLATLYAIQGKKGEARIAFQDALQVDPAHADTLFNFTLFLADSGEKELARQYGGEFLKLHGDSARGETMRAFLKKLEQTSP